MNEVWIEKYRPRNIDEIIGQQEVISRLKAYVKGRNLPHLIFTGPVGTGKTTSAIALARQLYGGDNWNANFLELNASDERGIQVVRTTIKEYARTAPLGDVPFKIIFLDEADALTSDAQNALKRTMEMYSHICRFIFSCNYSSKLIPAIQSRTKVFRFSPLKEEEVIEYLKRIVEKEGLKIQKDAYDALVYISAGDMRKATNLLQTAAMDNEEITSDMLYLVSSMAKEEDMKNLITTSIKGDFLKSREILDDLLIKKGLSGEDVIRQIHRVIFDLSIPEELKVEVIDKVGEIEFRIVEGSNDRLQLEALMAYFVYLGKRHKLT
jgi:replication factor C small subunit